MEESFTNIFKGLPRTARMLVMSMLSNPTLNKKEAGAKIGLSPAQVWQNAKGINLAVKLGQLNAIEAAIANMEDSLAKATMVLSEGMDSKDERMKHQAAVEILDRILGKASQSMDITSGGKSLGENLTESYKADLDRAYGE